MDGFLVINKEKGMTSHDVVMAVRRLLNTRKVGHCGTLDPEAMGVLVVGVNKATKAIQFLSGEDKEYITTLSLGTSTDSYDASGKVVEEKPFHGIENLDDVLASFIGRQKQIPPMYSAIKVNGKKLYEYARHNQAVDIKPRPIEIKELELLDVCDNEMTLRVVCSKGTYIRSLCVDIASKLGYPGHMKSLVRTRSGQFSINESYYLKDIEEGHYCLISLDEVFSSFDRLVVDESIPRNGKLIKSPIDHRVAIYNKEGHVLAIYGPDGQGYLKSIRGLF